MLTWAKAGDATELKGISLAFKDVLQGNAPLQIGSVSFSSCSLTKHIGKYKQRCNLT
jgi:hypothetical protein